MNPHPRGRVKQPSTVRKMTDVEASWVGAMLEGEGSIGIKYEHRAQGTYRRAYLALVNTSVETIATILRLVGDGRIYTTPGVNKPIWVWQLVKIHSVSALLKQLRPYLTDKRERADMVLEFLEEGS